MLTTLAHAELRTEAVQYQQDNTPLQGYLAYDDKIEGRRPGILIVHEWWGLNNYVKGRTEQLARLGYVAFAVDMYGNGLVAQNPQTAGKLAGSVRNNPQLELARVQAALDSLKSNTRVDPAKIAIMGYCFGGGVALDFARSGADIRGAISFHGALESKTPAAPNAIKAQILVLHGADDPLVPFSQVTTFIDEMKKANANYQVNLYSHAVHAFTNPEADKIGMKGIGYNAQADKRSWQALRSFLDEIFTP
jgi:dienelactone hydrolase